MPHFVPFFMLFVVAFSNGRTIRKVMGVGEGFSAGKNFFFRALLVQEFFFQVRPLARIFFQTNIAFF